MSEEHRSGKVEANPGYRGYVKLNGESITLKAFASSSPGFALKPWVQKTRKRFLRNSEGVANALPAANVDATPSELRLREMNAYYPGLPKLNPGLELANAFSVIRRILQHLAQVHRATGYLLILIILETERLILRKLSPHDAEFILELLNEPSFMKNIGDKGVRTRAGAEQYILDGPMASYERFGFGLYRVELKDSGVPIGICGLLKRDSLPDVDVGFAFLPKFWSCGYAVESASAVMKHGRSALGIGRIVAITALDNQGSIKVLERIGLRFEGTIRLSERESEVRLFAADI